MAMTVSTLGLGRADIKQVHLVEADKFPKIWNDIIGREDSTTQEFERYKNIAGLGPAATTPEGTAVDFDAMTALHSRDFYPVKVTKGVKFSIEAKFTDQYNKLKNMAPRFAKSFYDKKCTVTANLDNLGFTATTYGMNSEALYATSHSNGTATSGSANRPATDVAFGPSTVAQMLTELRGQRDARNGRMRYTGNVLIKVPAALEFNLAAILRSIQLPGTANNDTNYLKDRVTGAVIDDYTSDTAWFARLSDVNMHGLFMLKQMPYDIMQLPLDQELMHKWVAYESYTVGWFDWHGTWGTTGA